MRKPVRITIAAALLGGSLGLLATPVQAAPPAAYCIPGAAPAPAAVTQAATGVSSTRATLRGTVNPNGCPTTYHFEYGMTTMYGTKTAATSAGSGRGSVSAVVQIAGLTPGATYHFRIVATSAGGTIDGRDAMFKTPTVCSAPLAVTRPASSVSATTAVLNGVVGAHSCKTSYEFQYGRTTAYGGTTRSHSVGSGSRNVSVAALIRGLARGAVYHFRVVAINSAGTTVGRDATFRTPKTPRSRIRIDSRRPAVLRGFVVAVHLHCTVGQPACGGSVTLSRNGKFLGRQLYSLAPTRSGTAFVRLDRLGRRLMRHHRQLRHVEVVARSANNRETRFVVLVRTFTP